jgi:hypothetical protein
LPSHTGKEPCVIAQQRVINDLREALYVLESTEEARIVMAESERDEARTALVLARVDLQNEEDLNGQLMADNERLREALIHE